MVRSAALAVALVLSGCGGGGGGGGSHRDDTPPVTPTPPPVQESNVATLQVGAGLYGVPNLPTVSVTVCVPGDATRCQVLDNILLDTGSTGLRVVSSALAAKTPSPALPAVPADLSGSPLYECVGFIDGSYAWGGVRRADVKIGGETASNIPIQVIGDVPASGARPSHCTDDDASQDLSVAANLGANGILGVKYFIEDCGLGCTNINNLSAYETYYYYSCGINTCTAVAVPLNGQVKNPVAAFTLDNNGVLVRLPAIPATGQPSVSGELIFGINTRTNNQLGVVRLFDRFTVKTLYGGRSYTTTFFDSGSNGLYFDDPGIPLCSNSIFYCPGNNVNFAATITDASTYAQTVPFGVANTRTLSGSNFAFNNLAGFYSFVVPDQTQSASQVFDWGLPFFFGRTLYFGMEGSDFEDQVGF